MLPLMGNESQAAPGEPASSELRELQNATVTRMVGHLSLTTLAFALVAGCGHSPAPGDTTISSSTTDDGMGAVVMTKELADADAGGVAVAAMGRSLALAWTPRSTSSQPAPPEVHLLVLTESGDTLGEAVLHDLDAPGRISVVASPDARSIVVAWGQRASASRISMARADCIGGS